MHACAIETNRTIIMLHIRFLAIRPSSPISGELLVTHWFDTAIGTDERTALLAIAINELDSAASAHGGDVEYVRVDDPLGGPDDRLAIVVVEHNDIALIAALSESETDAAHILYARHVLAQLCKVSRSRTAANRWRADAACARLP